MSRCGERELGWGWRRQRRGTHGGHGLSRPTRNRLPGNNSNTDPQVIMAVLSSVLGAVNRSTVGVGGDGEGSRMAAIVCHEVPDLGYQVNMIHADAA